MKFFLDDTGYPAEFDIDRDLQNLLTSGDNWYLLNNFYEQLTPIIEYWRSLQLYSEMRCYGEISKEEYEEIVELHIREYLQERIEKRIMVRL